MHICEVCVYALIFECCLSVLFWIILSDSVRVLGEYMYTPHICNSRSLVEPSSLWCDRIARLRVSCVYDHD